MALVPPVPRPQDEVPRGKRLAGTFNQARSMGQIKREKRDREGIRKKVLVAQLCLTLCNPIDCSPPGSSVHGILQARKLE